MRNNSRSLLFAIVVFVLITSITVLGQTNIPLKEQIPVILKALNYNKTIGEKVKKNVNIALIYNPANELSKVTMEEIAEILKDNDKIKIFKKKIKVIPIEFTTKDKLEKKVFIKKLNAFFLCPGVEKNNAQILEIAKFNKIITISSNQNDIINSKATLGVAFSGGKFKPYINLINAKENNVDIDFKLLKIAEVIK
ncbi:MAG: DUF4154 domain-containing protein [Calditrichia bacterium]|nr:DUF4154 domain-containing protein [Calditrichia bacterium]